MHDEHEVPGATGHPSCVTSGDRPDDPHVLPSPLSFMLRY